MKVLRQIAEETRNFVAGLFLVVALIFMIAAILGGFYGWLTILAG